ncbi:MAG: hypothetical protein A4E62_01537 [Syntrophorhabdus sp. PtaU1.Bin002]|nr:MAG: hypothetical protein A4E58_02755 [Syntrophorhabdus sp. PtaB.Bin006]OPY70544.1 MAG: hypothetical protein A4E62_01537 [Syntrophorhabdus sp. PtaU1.Bin002]
MKRFLMIALAVLMGVSLVTTVFAQGMPGKEAKPAPGASPKDTGAPSVTKEGPAVSAGAAKVLVFKGTVVSIDTETKTMVAKDKKGEKTFDVSQAKNMPKLKAGDQVSFRYVEKDGKLMAGSFAKKGAKAAPKGKSEAVSAGVPVPKDAPAKAEPAKPAEPAKK